MKKILIMCLALLGLSSCGFYEKTIPWKFSDKIIPAEGGTFVGRPDVKDPYIFPTIEVVYLYFYDENDDWDYETQVDVEAEKIAKDNFTIGHYETIKGEWFEIVAQYNLLTINFAPNDTPCRRGVAVDFRDGNPGGRVAIVYQEPMNTDND